MRGELMTTKGTFADVVDAQVRAMFDNHAEEQSNELYYKELGLSDYEPDVPEEKMQEMSGPGRGQITIEGQDYAKNSKVKGYPVTLTLRKYTFDLEWTEEDVHWLAKQSSSKRVSDLRDAASGAVQSLYQNINEDTAKVFYLGHGTTFLTVGNSEALYGSHTLKGTGETQKNTFATGDTHRAFGPTALTDAISIMNRFKAHNGIQMKRVRSLKLLVATENIAVANQVIYSMYGPNTANLGLSQASKDALARRKMTIEATEVPDFPYAYRTYWSLVDTQRSTRRAFMAWAWKPRMTRDTIAKKGTLKMLGSSMFGPIVLGWQWTFGSKGDGSAI
jgi:hypothetical protein